MALSERIAEVGLIIFTQTSSAHPYREPGLDSGGGGSNTIVVIGVALVVAGVVFTLVRGRRKKSGQISQIEFEVLASSAQTQNAEPVGQSPVLLEQNDSEKAQSKPKGSSSTFTTKRGLIVFAAIVLLAFAFKSTQQGDPKDSKEYKQLLQQKTQLLAKKAIRLLTKTELEGKIGDVNKLQSDIDEYTGVVERWKQRISDVNSLGITG